MFSEWTELAITVAIDAHDGQVRKGGDGVPYVVHPLHVGALLARLGLDDEVVQAGVLHDVVEDCAEWTIERVREAFGERVAALVDELTEDKSLPWSERKQAWIDGAAAMSADAAHVKACDKLHNLSSLALDLERAPETAAIWASFKGGRDSTVEMASGLVEVLAPRVDARLGEALRAALERVRALA